MQNTPKPLDVNLNEGMSRISPYQTYNSGVDTRSGSMAARDEYSQRVMIGTHIKDGVPFYGMKVSKPGYDVLTASDSELIFNSNQNIYKIVSVGTVVMPTYTVTRSAGWKLSSVAIPPNAVVTHNVGGVPVVFAFIKVTGGGGPTRLVLPYTDAGVVGTAAYFHTVSIAVNGTSLEIGESHLTNGDVGVMTGGGFTVEYWILQETS